MTTSKSAWTLYVLGTLLQGVLIWRTAALLHVRFHGHAPTFSGFPEHCHAAEGGPIENCSILRGGKKGNYRLPGLQPPRYNATVAETTAYYRTLITEGVPLKKGGTAWLRELMQCSMVEAQDSYLHARCLTTFMGYPDDLIVSVQCSEESPDQAEAWIYSQSRQGYWDWMVNSARIRLMVAIQDQPFAKPLNTGNPCGGSGGGSGSGSR